MNIRTLIISDLHLKWERADKIISKESPDKIVFLGDYFDDFGDDYRENTIMAEWLVGGLSLKNRTYLMGNHDINYAIPHNSYKCSGYEAGKDYAINSVLSRNDWEKLPLFTWVGSWFCSHAGIHNDIYQTQGISYGKLLPFKKWIEIEARDAMKDAFELKPAHYLLRAGRSRGGREKHGGIIWQDIREYSPIKGVNQIFGHTPVIKPEWIIVENHSKSLGLDVSHSHYYALHDSVTDDVVVKWIGDW